MKERAATTEPASFRDPDARVWEFEGRVLRTLDGHTAGVFQRLQEMPWLAEQMAAGRLVRTSLLDRADWPANLPAGVAAVLEHERLPLVTYPYEWSFSMLADAGLLQLDVQAALLAYGFSLKDASAFNVIFAGHSPCFIDLGSFERPARLDVWYAYGQFCRMFLFPLLLKLHRGVPLAGQFLPGLDGVDLELCYRCLGPLRSWSPACLLDVGLQHALQRKPVPAAPSASRPAGPAQPGRPEAQQFNLRRLRKKLEQLKHAYRPAGNWSTYRDTHSYEAAAEQRKQKTVRNVLERARPAWVLDLGCNTGTYACIAADAGARVIAVDSDHDSIERLYRELQQRPAAVHPLVANLATPSPGAGYLGEERKPLLDRIQADAVLALALVHHLLISARLSLPMVADLFRRVSRNLVIVEYVDPSDEMFQAMLRYRRDDFSGLTLAAFRNAMAEHFVELFVDEIKPGKRWLLGLKRKPGLPI
jgi:SAM-dependent methyltransferase